MDPGMMGDRDDPNTDPLGNQLGYFPSSLALVVKGTSLIHTRLTRPAIGTGMPAGGGDRGAAPGGRPGVAVARFDGRDPPKRRVALAAADATMIRRSPRSPAARIRCSSRTPTRVWNGKRPWRRAWKTLA